MSVNCRFWQLVFVSVLVSIVNVFSSPADMSTSVTPVAKPPELTAYQGQNMTEFFPAAKGKLFLITWAHAVNSQKKLEDALKSSVNMMEADVVMGTADGNPDQVPIMAHPPNRTSDLTLHEFLRKVIAHNTNNTDTRKGIKLDFKTTDAFNKAIDILQQEFGNNPYFPVWLNADILAGPVNSSTTAVEPVDFLTKSKTYYPNCTLSLGWTTRWGNQLNGTNVPTDEAKYQADQVQNMENVIKSNTVNNPITFAVRAGLAANSLANIQNLLKGVGNNSTVTVWSSEGDSVNVSALKEFILNIGLNRTYVDVPKKLYDDLKLGNSATAILASPVAILLSICLMLGRLSL